LQTQAFHQIETAAAGFQERLDFPERQADELEGNDLLETGKVLLCIKPVSGTSAAAGFQQAQPVIVVQSTDRHSGFFRKLVDPEHRFPSPEDSPG